MHTILTAHSGDIAQVRTEVHQLARDIEGMQKTNSDILSKLDRLSDGLARQPHVPQFKDIAFTSAAIIGFLGGIMGVVMWFASTTFATAADPIRASVVTLELRQAADMRLMEHRVKQLEGMLKSTPSFRDYPGS